MTGAYNTASGISALAFNTTGNYNTASGVNALRSNTTGFQNTASGMNALSSNTIGNYNTAVGTLALFSNTTGFSNVASGLSSLYSNTTGYFNTASGVQALYSNTTGFQNTASGVNALSSNTTGSFNLANGFQAGYGDGTANMQSTVDNYATFLGFQASRDASVASTTPLTNITAIGKNARVGASNTIVLGGTGADAVNVGIGATTPLSKLDVNGGASIGTYAGVNVAPANGLIVSGNVGIGTTTPAYTLHVATTTVGAIVARFQNGTGYCDINPTNTALVCTSDETLKKNIVTLGKPLDTVMALRGVNFNWNVEEQGTPAHIGFIAQEVEKVVPSLVATDITTGKKSVNYIGFTPILVEAIKELADKVNTVVGKVAGFAQQMTTDRVVTKELCVGNTCVTESELQALLINAKTNATPTPLITPTSSSTPAVISAITLQIQGNNPATINVGDVYGDLGAVITAPASAMNYGIKASLDGGVLIDPAQITVNTKVAGVHHIVYTVVDQAGATTTAERILNVVAPLTATASSTPVVASSTPATSTVPTITTLTQSLVITATTTGSVAGLLTATSTPVI